MEDQPGPGETTEGAAGSERADFPPTPTLEQRPDAHTGGRGIAGESCVEAFWLGDVDMTQTGTVGVLLVAPLIRTALCKSCARALGLALLRRGAMRDDGTDDPVLLVRSFTGLLEQIGPKEEVRADADV